MKLSLQAGSTGIALDLFIQAATSTAGEGLAGLLGTSAGLTCFYHRPFGTAVPVTLTTGSLTQAYTTGLFVEINSTAMPGFYTFHPPDTALASGAKSVSFMLKGASGMVPLPLEIELTAWNNQDATAGGINNLTSSGTLGSVSNIRGTATVLLAPQTHTSAVIPIVQTASNLVNTVVLAAQTHTSAVIPVVQTASNLVNTVVLAAQTHTSAVIPVVQTASVALVANNVGTATTVLSVDTVRTSTVSDFTAGALARFFDLDAGTFSTSSANSVVRQITTNAGGGSAPSVEQITTAVWAAYGTGTVMLRAAVHTGAIVPIVQTASNLVNTVVLAPQTHTATVATVNAVGTVTGVPAVALTAGERATLATVIGTASQAEAYPGTGTGGSGIAAMLYEIRGHLGQSLILTSATGTIATKAIKKLDQTTTAQTYQIDLTTASTPIGIQRAS